MHNMPAGSLRIGGCGEYVDFLFSALLQPCTLSLFPTVAGVPNCSANDLRFPLGEVRGEKRC